MSGLSLEEINEDIVAATAVLKSRKSETNKMKRKNAREKSTNISKFSVWERELSERAIRQFQRNVCLTDANLKDAFVTNTGHLGAAHFRTWKKRFLKKFDLRSTKAVFDSDTPKDPEMASRIRLNWRTFDGIVRRLQREGWEDSQIQVVNFDETYVCNNFDRRKFVIPTKQGRVPGGAGQSCSSRAMEGLGVFLSSASQFKVPPVVLFSSKSERKYVRGVTMMAPEGSLIFDRGNANGKHSMDTVLWAKTLEHLAEAKAAYDRQGNERMAVIYIYDDATCHKLTGKIGQHPSGVSWSTYLYDHDIHPMGLAAKTTPLSQVVEIYFAALKAVAGGDSIDRSDPGEHTMQKHQFWQVYERLRVDLASKFGDFGYTVTDTIKRHGGTGLRDFDWYRCNHPPANVILDRADVFVCDNPRDPNEGLMTLSTGQSSGIRSRPVRQSALDAYAKLSKLNIRDI
jgi:hypothetical protein